jgi:hypothetical protein
LPAWLTGADIDYYVSEFEQSGFRGPLNRYRNNDRDFTFPGGFEGRRIEQPALYIGGEGAGFSRCSETACPSCEAHCRTSGGFTCLQAAATGLSRSGLRR